jgi:hypothetical protein
MLSPVTALRWLTETGYQVPGLTPDNAGQIVAWILGLSCFSLTYSSTEEALQLLGAKVGQHPNTISEADISHAAYCHD